MLCSYLFLSLIDSLFFFPTIFSLEHFHVEYYSISTLCEDWHGSPITAGIFYLKKFFKVWMWFLAVEEVHLLLVSVRASKERYGQRCESFCAYFKNSNSHSHWKESRKSLWSLTTLMVKNDEKIHNHLFCINSV